MAKTASHTMSVPEGSWKKAASWYSDPGPGFTLRTSCLSSPAQALGPMSSLLRGSVFVQDGSPRKDPGRFTGKAYWLLAT